MGKASRLRVQRKDSKEKAKSMFESCEVQKAFNKRIDSEVKKILEQNVERFYQNETAIILHVLADEFDFDREKLLQFVDAYGKKCDELLEFYDMGNNDLPFISQKTIMDRFGIDVKAEREKQRQKG